jgi:hypothetical protein
LVDIVGSGASSTCTMSVDTAEMIRRSSNPCWIGEQRGWKGFAETRAVGRRVSDMRRQSSVKTS